MNDLIDPAGLVERIPGTSKAYWSQLRYMGTGPRFIKPSPKKVLYRWADVETWLKSKEQASPDKESA